MKNEEAVLRMKLSNAKILGQKKWHGTQLKRFRGTGIPYTRISEPTPWDVSIVLIISCVKITSFLKRDSKRMLQYCI